MLHSLIVAGCLFLALSTQGVPLTSDKSNETMSKRSYGGHTMIVDSDVHDNVMNSRQATEYPSDSEPPRDRRAFHINGGTTSDNVVNIRPSQTGGHAMSEQNPTKSKGFFIDGKPLVVNGADGSRTLNPAVNADKSRRLPNSAPLSNDRPFSTRESIDDDNTTETPVVVGSRDFDIYDSNVYKNQMNSRRSIDEDITTETPVVVGSRDFHIDRSNVYKNQMNSRGSIDEDITTETPVVVGSRDFHIDHSNVYKNQMNSRRSIDEGITTETPVVVGSRDFHIDNSNVYKNQMNSRRSIEEVNTIETPVVVGSRDFRIVDSNVYKNQMNSRRSVEELNTIETPVVAGSRDFHFSNNNMFDNQNNTHAKLDTPPLPKKDNK